MTETQTGATPPGVIDSFSGGFSTVAQKPVLLLIPILLDPFLWLGPRLSISPIAANLAAQSRVVTGETTDNSAALFEENTAEILGSYNLLSALSTWPLGAPSLLAGNDPGTSPVGSPRIIKIHSPWEFILWLLVLVLTGLLLGTVYLGLIARSVARNRLRSGLWLRRIWLYWARVIAFVFVTAVAAFLLSVPFFLAVEIVAAVLAPLAPLMLLAGIGLGMWFLFHLLFATHGILLKGIGVRRAIIRSIALVRQYRLSSAGLLVIAVVISLGLSTIWNIPSSESWLRLIGLVGNAFVNTGLVTATFIYYRERTID